MNYAMGAPSTRLGTFQSERQRAVPGGRRSGSWAGNVVPASRQYQAAWFKAEYRNGSENSVVTSWQIAMLARQIALFTPQSVQISMTKHRPTAGNVIARL
jgi:hypothetical protein